MSYTGFLLCVECDTPTYHPLWVRYEHRDYHPHCWRCYALRTTALNAAAAIEQASAIVRSVVAV